MILRTFTTQPFRNLGEAAPCRGKRRFGAAYCTKHAIRRFPVALYFFAEHIDLFAEHIYLFTEHIDLFAEHIYLFAEHIDLFTEHIDLFAEHINLFAEHIYLFAEHIYLFAEHIDRFAHGAPPSRRLNGRRRWLSDGKLLPCPCRHQ